MPDLVAELAEYQPKVLPLSTATARLLVTATGGHVRVTPAEGGWLVQPQQYVGTVVLPGLRLLVTPKVKMENLFLMLGAGVPDDAWRPERFAFGTTRDVLPAFAAFFTQTCRTTLARGLLRSYRGQRERLVALRGRVDIPAQLRQSGVDIPVACAFDELTDDTLENRLVKAAIMRLLKVPDVDVDLRRSLRRELHRFEGIADAAPDLAAGDRIAYTRLNAHYEPLVRLSLVVLRGLTLSHAHGGTAASSFLLDMNELFQRFVTVRLRAALRGRLTLDAEPVVHLGAGRQVPMQPDLVFAGPAGRYVGDAKYKLLGGTRGRSGDYYQLLAYATAMSLREGVLVYASHDGERPLGTVEVAATGHLLHTWQVPLNGPRAAVDRAIADLADWVVERTAGYAVRAAAGAR